MKTAGIDLAGLMIERTNDMSLGSYMQKYIWEPLGITNMTFHILERPDMHKNLTGFSERIGGVHPMFGTPAHPTTKLQPLSYVNTWWHENVIGDAGGAGAYGTIVDYQKVLHSITANDGKLLSSKMCDELFKPQLSASSREDLMKFWAYPEVMGIQAAGLPHGAKLDHGLGGVITLEDTDGQRRKGSMSWSGLPNNYWWADRDSGVSGVYGSQVLATGDPKSIAMFKEFERGVYQKVKEVRGKILKS